MNRPEVASRSTLVMKSLDRNWRMSCWPANNFALPFSDAEAHLLPRTHRLVIAPSWALKVETRAPIVRSARCTVRPVRAYGRGRYRRTILRFAARGVYGQGQSKSAATNSLGSKAFRSAIFSPTPTHATGTLRSSQMPMMTPPLAVPSSLVSAIAVMPTAS